MREGLPSEAWGEEPAQPAQGTGLQVSVWCVAHEGPSSPVFHKIHRAHHQNPAHFHQGSWALAPMGNASPILWPGLFGGQGPLALALVPTVAGVPSAPARALPFATLPQGPGSSSRHLSLQPGGQAVAPTYTQGPAGGGQVEVRAAHEIHREEVHPRRGGQVPRPPT